MAALVLAARAADVRIGWIDMADKYATLHFETDANRTYYVQAVTNSSSTNWVTIYTAPSRPFPNHYIYADQRTNKMRIYRLFVVP